MAKAGHVKSPARLNMSESPKRSHNSNTKPLCLFENQETE